MNIAEISFEIAGRGYALTPPTVRIGMRVSRAAGGVKRLLDRLRDGDFDAYALLLAEACPDVPKKREDLEAFVYEHLSDLIEPCVEYALVLMNAGRPVERDAGGDGGAHADPGESETPTAG